MSSPLTRVRLRWNRPRTSATWMELREPSSRMVKTVSRSGRRFSGAAEWRASMASLLRSHVRRDRGIRIERRLQQTADVLGSFGVQVGTERTGRVGGSPRRSSDRGPARRAGLVFVLGDHSLALRRLSRKALVLEREHVRDHLLHAHRTELRSPGRHPLFRHAAGDGVVDRERLRSVQPILVGQIGSDVPFPVRSVTTGAELIEDLLSRGDSIRNRRHELERLVGQLLSRHPGELHLGRLRHLLLIARLGQRHAPERVKNEPVDDGEHDRSVQGVLPPVRQAIVVLSDPVVLVFEETVPVRLFAFGETRLAHDRTSSWRVSLSSSGRYASSWTLGLRLIPRTTRTTAITNVVKKIARATSGHSRS